MNIFCVSIVYDYAGKLRQINSQQQGWDIGPSLSISCISAEFIWKCGES